MKDHCIISFASHGRDNYNRALLNLAHSIVDHWDGDTLLYSFDGTLNEYNGIPINLCHRQTPKPVSWDSAQHHWDVPYQFKVAIFQIARERGYKKVIWCDSTIMLKQNPLPLFDKSENGIIAFHNLGHPLWSYISDAAQGQLNITDEELKDIEQIMACVVGFDFDKPKANEIFDEWVKYARDGVSFLTTGSKREGFKAHRHDQAVLSALLWKHSISLIPYGTLVYSAEDRNKEFAPEVYFVNQFLPEYSYFPMPQKQKSNT